ncbi:4Fe-4S binding protein [Kiritimatiellaeota bacterium B1221]|nr:4Fe-4S binding protein [Kiritimatiellaeota bacterium B1221]
MSFMITDCCTACDACRLVCPTNAVSKGSPIYKIDGDTCNDCADVMGGPRCIPSCPEAGAIIFKPKA